MRVRVISQHGDLLHALALPRRRPGRPTPTGEAAALGRLAAAEASSQSGLYAAARRMERRARRLVYRLA